MNAENFADFLKDYSKLYQLSYEELKSLVLQYPYCSNLHYLLVEKSQLDQHKEFEQNLRTASFYAQDRAALRQLIQKLKVAARQMESFDLAEDYLELKDLSSLDQEIEPIFADDELGLEPGTDTMTELFPGLSDRPDTEETPSDIFTEADNEELNAIKSSEELPANGNNENKQEEPLPEKAGEALEELFDQLMAEAPLSEETDPQVEIDKDTFILEESANTEENIPSPSLQTFSIDQTDDPSTEAPDEETPTKSEEIMEMHNEIQPGPVSQPRPTPKSSFTSWIQQFQPAHVKVQLGELMESKKREDAKQERKKKKKKKKKKDKVVLFAERSLKEPKDLATESLAELLVNQEQYDKAIEMYKRLILIFPEKSSYFADKINNLKNQ